MPDGTDFWLEGPDAQSKVLSAFEKTGAKAIVAETVSPSVSTDRWLRIGNTDYYLYVFPR